MKNSGGQNCRNFDLVPKILSAEILSNKVLISLGLIGMKFNVKYFQVQTNEYYIFRQKSRTVWNLLSWNWMCTSWGFTRVLWNRTGRYPKVLTTVVCAITLSSALKAISDTIIILMTTRWVSIRVRWASGPGFSSVAPHLTTPCLWPNPWGKPEDSPLNI